MFHTVESKSVVLITTQHILDSFTSKGSSYDDEGLKHPEVRILRTHPIPNRASGPTRAEPPKRQNKTLIRHQILLTELRRFPLWLASTRVA
jgi:hypothetical protein